jgi:DNA gyrase subunit A
MDITEKTGNIVDGVVVDATDKLMIITRNGITIRMEVAGIARRAGSTKCVKLINLASDDTIGSNECLARIEDAEEAGNTGTKVAAEPYCRGIE